MVRIYKKNAQILKGALISKNLTSRGKGTQAPRKSTQGALISMGLNSSGCGAGSY